MSSTSAARFELESRGTGFPPVFRGRVLSSGRDAPAARPVGPCFDHRTIGVRSNVPGDRGESCRGIVSRLARHNTSAS